jgi:aminopeptidase YwaD
VKWSRAALLLRAPLPHDHLMTSTNVARRIQLHLDVLANRIGARPPGSPANRRATDYLRATLEAAGLRVDEQPFTTRWWEPGPGTLVVEGRQVPVAPDPFSTPCDVRGVVVRPGSADELRRLSPATTERIIVLDGELSAAPYFPKAFPFLRFDEQLEVIALLEALQPAAVVALAPNEPPFGPVFEDADLAFPSTTVPPAVGDALGAGAVVRLVLGGAVHAGAGVNTSARVGSDPARMVLSAHIDSKVTTPGAFDNAGSVAALLALAESGAPELAGAELVFFNGEDHYAAPGEQAWLAQADLDAIDLVINVDGAGLAGRGSSIATLSCPSALEQRVAELVQARPGWVLADPWFESDHAIFAQRGIPSLAITSDGVHELLLTLAHTAEDTVDKVDPTVLADVTDFLRACLRTLRHP